MTNQANAVEEKRRVVVPEKPTPEEIAEFRNRWIEPVWGVVRHAPVCFALLALMWVLFVVGGDSYEERRQAFGLQGHSNFFSLKLLASGATVGNLRGMLLASLAVVALAVPAERLMGSRRFGVVAVAAQVIVAPLVFAIAKLMVLLPIHQWTDELANERFLSPVTWIAATLAFSSAYAPLLWRRRIRIFLVSLSVTLVVYSGSLSDVAFLTASILGAVSGSLIHSRATLSPPKTYSVREARVIIAIIVGAVALGPIIAFINPHAAGPLSGISRLVWEPAMSAHEVGTICRVDPTSESCREALAVSRQDGIGPFVANAMPLAVQFVFLLGLVRGRRFAWVGLLVIQFLTAVGIWLEADILQDEFGTSVTGSISLTTAVLPWLFTMVVLLWHRRRFQVRISAARVRRFWLQSAGALAATAALWMLGGYALRSSYSPHLTWFLLADELPMRYLPPPLAAAAGVEFLPRTSLAWILVEWPGSLFWIYVVWKLWKLLMTTPDETALAHREKARELLKKGSGDHLSWMSVWNGNRYWFDEEAPGSYVAYRVKNGIALTLGGPICAPGHAPSDIADRFERFVDHQGWQTAWYSVDEDFAESRCERGWHKQHVAEESVLDTALCEFKGKKFQNVRTARNHAKKEGIEAVWTTWQEATPVLREKMVMLSEQWLNDKALPEMRFTLGTISELKDRDTRILLALDAEGRLHGMTSWLPAYKDGRIDGLVLDFMRRDSTGFRPVIEFLISEGMLEAKRLGYEWISLSGAPLARSENNEPTILDNALDKVGEQMEPLYGFRSLAASKNKFQPVHHAWYMCYKDELALPSIGLAVCGCYLPELRPRDAVSVVRTWAKAQQGE